MGRPKKQTVDYFPHFVTGSRRTISILEARWKNDGYAFWFKLLELLCITDGHAFNLSTVANQEYLYSYTKTDPETADSIIEMLVDLENIDKELWEQHKIIWCQSLVDNLKLVYDKRTTPMPKKPFSVENIPENPPKTDEKSQSEDNSERQKPKRGKSAPKKPQKSKPDEPEKIKYAEFVRMTEEEHRKLVEQYGENATARMITVLDNYKGQSGKTYKSDYRAILNWVVERVQEEFKKNGGGGYGRNEVPAGHNGPNPGGFKPSGGFKK